MRDVFLDWDVRWSYWNRVTRLGNGSRSARFLKAHLKVACKTLRMPRGRIRVWYRRSSGRRVHVKVEFPVEWGFRDQALIRAYCSDDRARLCIDVGRYLEGQSTNRLFDLKYSGGKIRKAGPWVKWFEFRA